MKTSSVEDDIRSIPRDAAGVLSAAAVVAWAQAHKDSLLYLDLKQHAKNAVDAAMLSRAGELIRLYIVRDPDTGKRIEMILRQTRDAPHGGARPIETVMKSPELLDIAYRNAVAELRSIHDRYSNVVKKLGYVWIDIERALRDFDEENLSGGAD